MKNDYARETKTTPKPGVNPVGARVLTGVIGEWRWHEAFGFVAADAGYAEELFAHRRDFIDLGPYRYPHRGHRVEFEVEHDARGRRRAVRIRIVSGRGQESR